MEVENENYKNTENEIFDKKSNLVFIENNKTDEVTTRKIVKLRLE